MAVSGEGAAVLEPEIALRPFQGLDVRLLVDREHESALGRIKIEADDLRGLGDEIGVVALAPGLPPVEVDLLGPQEAPDILVADVAQSLGDEPARPAGIALRRRPPQHRQNAAVRRLVILGRGAAARTRAIIETRQPLFGEADAPMAHRTRHRAKIAGDRPGRRTLRAISTIRARNTCRCSPKPSLELRTLVRQKPDLSRIRKHAS